VVDENGLGFADLSQVLQEPKCKSLFLPFQICNDFAFLRPICKTSLSCRAMEMCPPICADSQLVCAICSCNFLAPVYFF
jgi:hypothetical protein